MKYSMSIAMVVILMAAAFVGVPLIDDETDAATNPITIDADDANLLSIVDGKIGGNLVGIKGEDDSYTYSFTIVIGDITGKNVYYTVPCACPSGPATPAEEPEAPTESADESGSDTTVEGVHIVDVERSTDGKVTFTGTKTQIEDQIAKFQFIVTSSVIELNDQEAAEVAFDNLYKDMGQTIGFDLKYSEDIIEIRYAVGDLVYVKSAMKGSAYALVTLEDLNAPTPERQKFVGWKDTKEGNTYPAGSAVVFSGEVVLTAVFEALPEAVITFVDGTSTLKSINVSDLNEKTVPSVEKTGYTFDGWFMGDVKVDPLTYTFEESVTLVAQWTPINCYVTFVAGDFVKTVPVLYGDRVQAPALPDGFEKWNFDFSVVITDDLTITAIEKAPEKPTGLADPTVKMAMVIVGLFVCVLLAVIILKREDIRAGMVRKLSKAEDVKEDKKE